jgi:energy-coupling factor transporter ATP-binding protein EcfA2
MDVERETKSGTVSRGFNVFVRSPDSADAVPWEAWSGGETQRLRLAGTMGLMDLIADRVGRQPTMEVFDEPTDRLSGDGIDDLVTLLSSRAKLEQKRIFLVDHRSLDAGRFDGQLRVVYNEHGSQLVWEGDKDGQ